MNSLDGEVQLKSINFKYENTKILQNINLSFIEKKKYFIYGPSGSGKTTLLEIICGLPEPSEGNIYISKKEIYSRDLIKSNPITYVPQEPYLVEGSLFDNVSMFDNKNDETQKKFEKSYKRLQFKWSY